MKNNIGLFILGLVVAGVGSLFGLTGVSAQDYFCESPGNGGVVWYKGGSKTNAGWLDKGDSYDGVIEACNSDLSPHEIRVYTAPFSIAQNDYSGPDFISQNSWNKLAEWISFPKGETYMLDSGETIYIPFRVNVPNDEGVFSGSQAASIMLEDTEVFGAEDTNGVLSVKRFSWLVYASVSGDGVRYGGQITDWKADGWLIFDNSKGVKANSVIENLGNVSIDAKYRLTITDLFRNGAMAFEKEAEQVILPESRRANEFNWSTAPAIGYFKISETISYLDESKTFEKTIVIFPLWLLIIIAAIILLLLIALILKIRNWREERDDE